MMLVWMIGMTDIVRGMGRRVQRLLYPPVCLICGDRGQDYIDCCSGCMRELPVAADRCLRCALTLPRTLDHCGRCVRSPPHYEAACAAYRYENPVSGLIHRFKFSGDLAAGRMLAALTALRLAAQGASRPDLMVPVPLHFRRRMQRGFNQSELLCRDLSRHLRGLPWCPGLSRRRATASQSELPSAGRRGNVRGAFRVRRIPSGTRSVALVDDVMTTGATVNECARMLRQAGVAVVVWVIARA